MHLKFFISAALAVLSFAISASAVEEITTALRDLEGSDLAKDTWEFMHDTKDYAHDVVEDIHSVFGKYAEEPKEHLDNNWQKDPLHFGPFVNFVSDTEDYAHNSKDYVLNAGRGPP
jgi:hypothetical protein